MMQTMILFGATCCVVALLCRLDGLHWKTHRWHVVGGTALLTIAVIFSGWQAAEGDAGALEVLVVLGAIAWLAGTWPTWKNGPPTSAESRPMPLDEAHG